MVCSSEIAPRECELPVSSYKPAALRDLVRASRRITRSAFPLFVVSLLTGFLVIQDPVQAAVTSTGNSGPGTSVETGTQFPQGTLPGALLTPMIRLDLNCEFKESTGESEGLPVDNSSILMSLRLRFTNTRAKDVAAIAIAREGGDTGLSPGSEPFAIAVDPANGQSNLLEDPDTMNGRQGDGDSTGQYTPDVDTIIAYVPMAKLLALAPGEDGDFEGLNPYSTNFTVTLNFVNNNKTVVPPFLVNSTKDPYSNLNAMTLATAVKANGGNVIALSGNDTRFATFYVLVAPSLSLENGSQIQVELDASGSPEIKTSEDGAAKATETYVFYNWSEGGLLVGVGSPAVEEVEPEEEEGSPTYNVLGDYTTTSPVLRGGIAGRLVCTDMAGDQVPERLLSSRQALSYQTYPPDFPPVSLVSRSEDADHNVTYTTLFGRTHPDADIFSTTYPSPEVLTSGGQTYSWFGFDFAGGWAGGYDWRIAGLTLEVQGLGELGEIPRDSIDNDLDGLTDEVGVEDTPQDRQLPGRNDDFDFWTDVRYPTVASATGVNGILLSATEEELSAAIMAQYDSASGNPRRGIVLNSFDKGWDPVFTILHLLDDSAGPGGFDPEAYNLPPKIYRDIFQPFGSLIGRAQPELCIRLEALLKENPRRAQYMASLFKIGALQSRGIDEDGDGEEGSPTVLGYKIADGEDNDGNGLTDEGIDEEPQNGIDDDGDGLIDEDVNFIPLFVNNDEELNNFFVDRAGGIANVYDPDPNPADTVAEGDFVFIDYNNNGIYDNGRNDQSTPNLDEFQGPGTSSPLTNGDPYSPPIVFPIDDDLDMELEDGNPLTPGVAGINGLDDDGDGLTDEGANEDIRDVILNLYGLRSGLIQNAWMYEDLNDNLRLDPGTLSDMTAGGDQPLPPYDVFSGSPLPVPYVGVTRVAENPDRYFINLTFNPSDAAPGTNIPYYTDQGDYDFFVGFQIPENMPIGADFQVSVVPGSVRLVFDTRSGFSGASLIYPITGLKPLTDRFVDLASLPGNGDTLPLSTPAQSQAYQVTKRQFSHLQMADGLGFQSPLEVQGGFYGLPYLDSLSRPFPVLALNIADAAKASATSDQVSEADTILNSIRINFDPVQLDGGLFDPRVDLRPLGNNLFSDNETGQTFADSGVSLYLDNKTLGEQGAFDFNDTPILLNLESLSWNEDKSDPVVRAGGYYVVLKPQAGVEIPGSDYWEIPNNPDLGNLDPNRGYDFFVCIRTHEFARARNTFRAFIRPGDISFNNGKNVVGSSVISHTYVNNIPIFVSTDLGSDRRVIPLSDSIPVLGFNMLDANNTFSGTPARWSLVNLLFENNPTSDTSFTPSDLLPITNKILRNIPLDPAEDNDGDSRTFPLPDGIDNDNDGLTDEGVNNTLDFNLNRYTTLSGVAIFRDMPNSDRNGLFDDPLDPSVKNPDVPVFLSGEEEFIFPIGATPYLSIALDHDPVSPNTPGKGDPVDPDPFEKIPNSELGVNLGTDYFVVIRTSKTISAGDDFRVRTGTYRTIIHSPNSASGLLQIVVGTSFGFMPGATTGFGPVFPNRQPYNFDPLTNARLVDSSLRIAEEPLSAGYLRLPGIKDYADDPRLLGLGIDFESELIQIEEPFNLYESYKRTTSALISNTENGSDLPSLTFLVPTQDVSITPNSDLDPGTVFLRWSDIDEDSPAATVTLVYFPIVEDPVLGEILPVTPGDSRFTFTVIRGAEVSLLAGDDIDNYNIQPYQNRLIAADNENVVPDTGYGTDILTWDARLVPSGTYRVGAILNDFDNPRVIAIGGKVVISNDRPTLVITEP